MTDPVSALVLRVADGDRAAFDTLYDVVAPRVDALCARILGPGPDAEDAAQQALCAVFERSTEYDPDRGPAWGWILTLTCWEARTVRRRRERRREQAGGAPERSVAPACCRWSTTPTGPSSWRRWSWCSGRTWRRRRSVSGGSAR